jgi:hypothetical protein
MGKAEPRIPTLDERLAALVEHCQESRAAFELLEMLVSIAQLDADARVRYLETLRRSDICTDAEMEIIERLILNGAARCFAPVIEKARAARVQREIAEMLEI